ncbi:tripartite tricarboxylate transporter substrate binding protein [Bordetella trematum]|uniref:tripartite tricarboxylate transporter substrate binding protein n=1 Tax=Bordetella trematum TaxID=123899 RepID=UPI0013FDDCA6|nr:tripartite tricarboxylate transporter substrate binding protein [Bordetella trematum]
MKTLIPAALAALALSGGNALAQTADYPNRAIRLVVPYAPGGTADIVARTVGQKLAQSLGQSVIVENRPGASGVIGWNFVARSAPDGYTLLATETGFSMAGAVLPKLPFDPKTDFTHLSIAAKSPFVMVTPADSQYTSVAQFVADTRAKPGTLNYGSAGSGSSTHLAGEWFQSLTGTRLMHIPYKGGSSAIQALMANEVQMAFPAIASTLEFIKTGKLKALMVTSAQRSAVLPDVPSAPEAGVPDMIGSNWFAFSVPSGTPADITQKLSQAINEAIGDDAVKTRLNAIGIDTAGTSPADAQRFVDQEIQDWQNLVTRAGISVQ